MNDYSLNKINIAKEKDKGVLVTAWRRLIPLMKEEGSAVTIAFIAIFFSSAATLVVPIVIGHIIDVYIQNKNFQGVVSFSVILSVVYIIGLIASYIQVKTMGGVGRRLLFNLRNKIFDKLEELPMPFFNQNKEGDIISRINNDTDKLNQFFSQALMQFIGNIVLIISTGVFLLVLNFKLGCVALAPAVCALLLTQLLSPWVKRTSLRSLRSLGNMSGEISESINNFKVIIAFNRLDYFRDRFKEVNEANYKASISAGIASNIFSPIYTLAGVLGQVGVLAYGIYLVSAGHFTIGLLVSFLLYVNNFYNPLRQLASVWPSLQLALAGLDRIFEILNLESNMKILTDDASVGTPPKSFLGEAPVLEFKDVFFKYSNGKEVLKNINFKLEKGKTYAFVGPTGGGKTTTASLMARLYDPTEGVVYLEGKDIRYYSADERAEKIGFILQEPFLFTGTVYENIIYGNKEHAGYSHKELMDVLERANLTKLLSRFSEGLDTKIHLGGDAISLGQKQLIAFMRAVLRSPTLLILDEATANIDTVTEQLLEEILKKLPNDTTRVVIAHRLNTIENADDIFFVNGGGVTHAGSMEQAVNMLLHGKRQS